jgi:hypothetical protein
MSCVESECLLQIAHSPVPPAAHTGRLNYLHILFVRLAISCCVQLLFCCTCGHKTHSAHHNFNVSGEVARKVKVGASWNILLCIFAIIDNNSSGLLFVRPHARGGNIEAG